MIDELRQHDEMLALVMPDTDRLLEAEGTRRNDDLVRLRFRTQRIAGTNDDGWRQIRMARHRACVLVATAMPCIHEAGERNDAAPRAQTTELPGRRNRPLPQQSPQERQIAGTISGARAEAVGWISAVFQLVQLLLQYEREIERHQKKLGT